MRRSTWTSTTSLTTVADVDHDPVELIRSEEQLVLTPRRRAIGRVRLRRVIVTEDVLLQVSVRREEVHIEHLPADGPVPPDIDVDDEEGVRYRMVLHHEVPEVVMRVVPRETVRVVVTTESAATEVSVPLRREEVSVDLPDGDDPPATPHRHPQQEDSDV